MKVIGLLLILAFCLSCSEGTREGETASGRQIDSKYQVLVRNFSDAIIQKDYRSAYSLLSPAMQTRITYDEFVETWQPYRDAFEGSVEAHYVAEEDPQSMAEFVPEADRANLVEEVTIEFSGMYEGEEQAFFCTAWIIDDGTPRIGAFYVED